MNANVDAHAGQVKAMKIDSYITPPNPSKIPSNTTSSLAVNSYIPA